MLSHVQLFCNPKDCSLPGSSIHGISQERTEKFLSLGNLSHPGIEPLSPDGRQIFFFTTEPPVCMHGCSIVPDSVIQWTAACQVEAIYIVYTHIYIQYLYNIYIYRYITYIHTCTYIQYDKAVYCHLAYLTSMQCAYTRSTFSCVQLCRPMDCSPPGSSVHGDSPGKNTGVGCQALLWSIQSTSCEMLGWMNHKMESRLLGEISTTSDMQMIPLK